MMDPKRRVPAMLSLAGALAVLGCGGSSAGGPGHAGTVGQSESGPFEIRFSRGVEPGYREKVHAVAVEKKSATTRFGEKVVKQDVKIRRVEIRAERRVLEVSSHGGTSASEYLVDELVARADGASRVLAQGGQKLVVRRGDPPVVTLDGQPMSPEDIDLLGLVVSTSPLTKRRDDEVFGISEPQLVGASWPIDAAAAAAGLGEMGLSIGPEAVNGQVDFLSVSDCAVGRCLELAAAVTVTDLRGVELPGVGTATSGQMQVGMRGLFPFDTSLPTVLEEENMAFVMLVPLQDTPNVTVELSSETTTQEETTPILQ